MLYDKYLNLPNRSISGKRECIKSNYVARFFVELTNSTTLCRPFTASSMRITKLEKNLDVVLQNFDDDDLNSDFESVESYLMRGNKLQAAKRLQQLNPGTSFHEAIQVVTAFKQLLDKHSAN